MKIVIMTRYLIAGGVQRLVVDEANELSRQGHEVWIVTFAPEQTDDSLMGECAISLDHLRMIDFPRLRSMRGYLETIRVLRDIAPDVLITHHWFANTVGRIAALFVRVKHVLSFEHSVYDTVKPARQFIFDWLLQGVSSRIVAVSNDVRSSLRRHHIASSRIAVVRNGLDLSRYIQAEPDPSAYFLFIGRLVGDKQIDVLLRALVDVPSAKLVIAGDGPERNRLEAYASDLGIRHRVQFLGVRYDIPELLMHAQALILPSRREGFGLVVVEAFAAGVPVIVSDVVAVHGVVRDEVNGLVVTTGDHVSLARAITRLTEPTFRMALSARTQENFERFSIATHVGSLLSLCTDTEILYIANIRLPTEKAHGLNIMKSCEALQRGGTSVELVVPERYTPISVYADDYYRIRTPFPVTYLAVPDIVRSRFFGFHLHTVLFAVAVAQYVRSRPRCTIYGRDAVVLLWIGLSTHHRVVWESHDGSFGLFSRLLTRVMRGMVVVSQGLKNFYTAHGVASDRILAVPNGIELSDFSHPESKEQARTRLGLPVDARIALYIGRLDGWKGTDTLVEAAKLLAPDIHVAFIGGERAQVKKRRQEHPDILFLGERPYGELADNQAAADVLVLPNTAKDVISVHFTSPLKLLTYMASGRPIVASDLPSIREIAQDAVIYVSPDDAASLAHGISSVFEHPSHAKDFSEKSRALVERYTWESRMHRILSFIHSRNS